MNLGAISYQLGIRLYGAGIRVSALFQPKARKWVKGRADIWHTLRHLPNRQHRKTLWFHAASLGEFEQGRPVIEAMRQQFPNAFILVSFFSPSGYEARQHYATADAVVYLPLDTKQNAQRWVDLVQPDLAVFIKYEIWPHYLEALQRLGATTLLMAARFYPKQIFFSRWGKWIARAIHRFDHILLQEEQQSAALLQRIGYTQFSYAPDTRFDRVIEVANEPYENRMIKEQTQDRTTILCGSIWESDLPVLRRALAKYTEVCWLLVPHDIEAGSLHTLLKQLPATTQRYSTLPNNPHSNGPVLIDTMGILARLYRYADAAYIGGGFQDGIHNILEAAVYGLPLAFGPKHDHFPEAKGLIQQQAAQAITNADLFDNWVATTVLEESARQRAGQAASQYVQQHQGGTVLTVQLINRLLKDQT